MAMTSYEIIRRNVDFTGPERIGLRFDRIAGVSDVYRIFILPPRAGRENPNAVVSKKVRPRNGEIDEWGCLWASEDETGSDMGQVQNVPLENWDELDRYVIPDPYAEGRFDGLKEALDEAEAKHLYVQLNSPQCIFERMHFLHGFENTMIDCLAEPEYMAELSRRLADYQIGIIKEAYRLGGGRIHCYDTTDDWGSQNALLVSRQTFRDLFKPQYKRVFDTAHECGMDVRLHTDGRVNELIPDFIDLGVNILNLHQPRLVGIDEIANIARGKICFEAAVDTQSTLPTGNKDLIAAEAKELCEKWATPEGGLIGVEYGYLKAIGVTKESMQYSLECFKRFGVLK